MKILILQIAEQLKECGVRLEKLAHEPISDMAKASAVANEIRSSFFNIRIDLLIKRAVDK